MVFKKSLSCDFSAFLLNPQARKSFSIRQQWKALRDYTPTTGPGVTKPVDNGFDLLRFGVGLHPVGESRLGVAKELLRRLKI